MLFHQIVLQLQWPFMKDSRVTVTVSIERAEFWGKKTPNSLVQMKTHCVQRVLALCCAVTGSINGEQASCHPAHQLSSVSWLEKPTSTPSFYSKSAKRWKSSCERHSPSTSKHVHVIHQEGSVTKFRPPHVWPYAWPAFLASLERSDAEGQLATSWSGR